MSFPTTQRIAGIDHDHMPIPLPMMSLMMALVRVALRLSSAAPRLSRTTTHFAHPAHNGHHVVLRLADSLPPQPLGLRPTHNPKPPEDRATHLPITPPASPREFAPNRLKNTTTSHWQTALMYLTYIHKPSSVERETTRQLEICLRFDPRTHTACSGWWLPNRQQAHTAFDA